MMKWKEKKGEEMKGKRGLMAFRIKQSQGLRGCYSGKSLWGSKMKRLLLIINFWTARNICTLISSGRSGFPYSIISVFTGHIGLSVRTRSPRLLSNAPD